MRALKNIPEGEEARQRITKIFKLSKDSSSHHLRVQGTLAQCMNMSEERNTVLLTSLSPPLGVKKLISEKVVLLVF